MNYPVSILTNQTNKPSINEIHAYQKIGWKECEEIVYLDSSLLDFTRHNQTFPAACSKAFYLINVTQVVT